MTFTSQKSTPVTIPATEVRRNLGNILKRTFSGREHFIIERELYRDPAKDLKEFVDGTTITILPPTGA